MANELARCSPSVTIDSPAATICRIESSHALSCCACNSSNFLHNAKSRKLHDVSNNLVARYRSYLNLKALGDRGQMTRRIHLHLSLIVLGKCFLQYARTRKRTHDFSWNWHVRYFASWSKLGRESILRGQRGGSYTISALLSPPPSSVSDGWRVVLRYSSNARKD